MGYKNNGWTATSIKPPEPYQRVLVWTVWGGYDIEHYIPPYGKYKKPDGYWGTSDGEHDYDYFNVAYWRELPEPPNIEDLWS